MTTRDDMTNSQPMRVVSVSLGSSKRNHEVEVEMLGRRLLIERIHAVLRRQIPAEDSEVSKNTLQRGDLLLDPVRHLCTWRGDAVNLTVTEFLLLEALARRPGHVKNRDQLIDAAYGEHIFVDDRTIDIHIKRLRRKFKEVDDDFSKVLLIVDPRSVVNVMVQKSRAKGVLKGEAGFNLIVEST